MTPREQYHHLRALLPDERTPVADLTRRERFAVLLYRDLLHKSFEAWCRHALAPLGQEPAAHHLLLIRELQSVAEGQTARLMVNMPPGSAKSTYSSALFPPWMLARKARFTMIGASNTASLAEKFSRRVMGLVREHSATLGYRLTREAAELWETSTGGEYRAAGVDGTIAGQRADLALIDDPVRSRSDVESEGQREKQWDWYTADLKSRLKPGASVVVIMTRWHPDDLGGRLLDREAGLWRVVSLPAVAGDNDPLGRAPGEWLWSDDAYGFGALLKQRFAEYEAAGAMRDWSALYQQQPVNAEGGMFRVGAVPVIDAEPTGWRWVRAWDLAATEQTGTRDPDWTAGVKLGRGPDGQFAVADVVRVRGGPDEVERTITATASRDGRAVTVSLPQDPGQAGKSQVLYLTRKLAGFRVETSPETGDKATRATPFASQLNVGNVALVRAPAWNRIYLDELAAFPGGVKDDQVDASSRAFNALIAPPGPVRSVSLNHMTR